MMEVVMKEMLAVFHESQHYLILGFIVMIPVAKLINYLTDRLDLTYFMWIGILCLIASILGLIGRFILNKNYMYGGITSLMLCLLSAMIGHKCLIVRGSDVRLIDILLMVGTCAGVFVVLYGWLFYYRF